MWAQAIATQLMIALCGARRLPGTIDIGGDGPPPATIRLRESRVRAILGLEIPRARQARDPRRAGLPDRAGAGRPGRDAAAGAPRRRDTRGRPDRGGRSDRRPGAAAGDAAKAPRSLRRAERRAAPAPPGGRRAGRSRAVRGRRLDVRLARRWPTACAWTLTIPGARAGHREPAVRGAVASAHDAARLAARHRRAQRRTRDDCATCGGL